MAPGNPIAMVPFSAVLKDLIHRYGLEAPMFEATLRERWPDIVGKAIAAHTKPGPIRHRRLTVYVESSAWLQELTLAKEVLLRQVNAAAGAPLVTDLVVKIGPVEKTG